MDDVSHIVLIGKVNVPTDYITKKQFASLICNFEKFVQYELNNELQEIHDFHVESLVSFCNTGKFADEL